MPTDLGYDDLKFYAENDTGGYTIIGNRYITTVTYDTDGWHDRTMPIEDWDAARDILTRFGRTSIEDCVIDFSEEPQGHEDEPQETEEFADSKVLSDFLDSFPIKNEVIASDST